MVNVHVLHECHREMSFRMKSENLAPSSPLERFWSQVLCPLGGPGVGGTPPPRVQAWASQPITVTGSSWCPGDTAGSGGGGGGAGAQSGDPGKQLCWGARGHSAATERRPTVLHVPGLQAPHGDVWPEDLGKGWAGATRGGS